MKSNSQLTLAMLAVVLALPATAQTPEPKPQTPPAKPAAPPAAKPAATSTASRVDQAFETMRQKVLAGDTDSAAHDELVKEIGSSYAALASATPDASTVRTRLVASVDDIYARAKSGKIGPEDFAALRAEMLDASLENALAEMATQPGAQSMEKVNSAFKQASSAAMELDSSAGEARTRAQALLDELKTKPAVASTDLEPLHEELAHGRAMLSVAVLEKHATAKGATKVEFARARNTISDLFALQSQRDPQAGEVSKKLVSALDDLEQRGPDAKLAKSDFELLRKEVAQHGRTTPAEKPAKLRG